MYSNELLRLTFQYSLNDPGRILCDVVKAPSKFCNVRGSVNYANYSFSRFWLLS